jgi:hypothetical protein
LTITLPWLAEAEIGWANCEHAPKIPGADPDPLLTIALLGKALQATLNQRLLW